MSFVDKALQAWEQQSEGGGRAARTEVPAGPQSERFSLGGYVREAPSIGHAPPEPPIVVAPAPAPAPASAKPMAKAAHRTRTDRDLDSRVVGGDLGPVPFEQYRRLAAALHDVQRQQGLKTLMLTSALPTEGKTLTTVNLALTLSDSYARRVLIIDADLRGPSVHKVLGVANEVGLNEALHGERFDLPIQQVSPRLAVLTAGRPGLTPLAGLTSPRMAALIDECANHFDWVFLDTPPVGLLPDAQLLARLTRAVVFIIAAGRTPMATVERAIAEIGAECVVGTVLNRVDERQIPEAGYYSRYGSYDDAD
jgi:protein-tyrosine kinase